MLSNNKNAIQDRKDLEKFIKFLALKSAQVIVQSRLGEKIHTQCNPNSSGDWFNLAIDDNPDVLAETKKVLNVNPGESISTRLPLSIEISLQTVEGDKMVLEVWSIGLSTEQSDPAQRPTYAVYNRMGLLLKSLISVTRVTPAYKLSRRQSSDSYKIYYRIYVGDPQVHNLGDGYKQVRVGQLCTTFGALNMFVAYRTKMTISPTHRPGHNNEIMLKSDHFLKDISPKHARYNKKIEKKVIDLDKPMKIGAFVDTSKTKQYTEADYVLPENPPFSWLLKKTKDEITINNENNLNNINNQQTAAAIVNNGVVDDPNSLQTMSITNDDNNSSTGTITTNNNNLNQKSFEISDHSKKVPIQNGSSPKQQNGCVVGENEIKTSKWSRIVPPEDERLLKELHFPFATNNTPISDLAKFYRDCFNAPPLHAFNEIQQIEEQQTTIEDLTQQLEQFETSLAKLLSSTIQTIQEDNRFHHQKRIIHLY